MLLPPLRQLLLLGRIESLSRLLEDNQGPKVVYIDSWIFSELFGENGEMPRAFQRLFRVSLVVESVPGCGVLIFIYGLPLFKTLAMLLIGTVSFQLRTRRNRAKVRAEYLQSCGWASRSSD